MLTRRTFLRMNDTLSSTKKTNVALLFKWLKRDGDERANEHQYLSKRELRVHEKSRSNRGHFHSHRGERGPRQCSLYLIDETIEYRSEISQFDASLVEKKMAKFIDSDKHFVA